MDGKMFARLVAVTAIAVAATATAVHITREGGAPDTSSTPPAIETPRGDQLRETLRRCQQMGEAASRDTGCLAAWDQNRRRFLTPAEEN